MLYKWLKKFAFDTLSTSAQKPDGSYTQTYNCYKLLESLKNEKQPSEALLLNNEQFKTLKVCKFIVFMQHFCFFLNGLI